MNIKVLFLQHGQTSGGLLCCFKKAVVNPDEDRVELAFRRIDLNNDGFITWDEFVQVFICFKICFNLILYIPQNVGDIEPAQAKRIFQTCDDVSGNRKYICLDSKWKLTIFLFLRMVIRRLHS